jgi:hypothetical protein
VSEARIGLWALKVSVGDVGVVLLNVSSRSRCSAA